MFSLTFHLCVLPYCYCSCHCIYGSVCFYFNAWSNFIYNYVFFMVGLVNISYFAIPHVECVRSLSFLINMITVVNEQFSHCYFTMASLLITLEIFFSTNQHTF